MCFLSPMPITLACSTANKCLCSDLDGCNQTRDPDYSAEKRNYILDNYGS